MRSGQTGPIVGAVVHVPVPRADWRARMKRRCRWVPTTAAMSGLLVVYAGWQLFRWPAGHRELFGDVAFYPVDLAVVGAAWVASRRCVEKPQLRLVWRPVAIAFACYFDGDVMWGSPGIDVGEARARLCS